VIGNLLHEDSLLKRLQKEIENKELSAIYKDFPLLDEKGYPLWPDKFPTENEINKEKMKVGNEIAWQREYLLHIISEAGRVVYPEWIHYYDPDNGYPDDKQFVQAYDGVDLAISEKENADYTAIVVMRIYEIDEKFYAYVMPFPVNKRIGFPDQVNEIKLLVSNTAVYRCPKIFVEKVAYQESIIQYCQSLGIQVEGISPHGEKRERIVLTTAAIKEGLILFPNKGAEDLVSQLTNFGTEKYNDLADAFAIAANQFIAYASAPPVRLTFL
jgi:predicted phage terminase large subunit-like protein